MRKIFLIAGISCFTYSIMLLVFFLAFRPSSGTNILRILSIIFFIFGSILIIIYRLRKKLPKLPDYLEGNNSIQSVVSSIDEKSKIKTEYKIRKG